MLTVEGATRHVTYEDLYARWERGNWSATEVDFSADRIDWHERMSEEQRLGALWFFSLFFHGEDAVAQTLGPYIDAAPRVEQKYFLTTQLVDEARHSVLFKRFLEEVVGVGSGEVADLLNATTAQLSWGHRRVFARLDEISAGLRKDRSRHALAAAVTAYHIVIEAGLGQPGQHVIEDGLERLDLLPGLRYGMGRIAADEQRHIAFGVKLLSDLYAEDRTVQEPIMRTVREIIPWTSAVSVPPGMDLRYMESLGCTLADLYEQGTRSLESRLRAIGLPLDEIDAYPLPIGLPPGEHGRRTMQLLLGGMLGDRVVPVSYDPETIALFFETSCSFARPSAVPSGTAIQWDFRDTDPWWIRVEDGVAAVGRGRDPHPTVRLRCRFEDWVDVSAGRVDAGRALLTGRLRIRGNPVGLVRLQRLLG